MLNWLNEGALLTALYAEYKALHLGHGISTKDTVTKLARDFMQDKGRVGDDRYNLSLCKKVAIMLQIKEIYRDQSY